MNENKIGKTKYDLVTANGFYDLQQQRYALLLSVMPPLSEACIRTISSFMGEPYTHYYRVTRPRDFAVQPPSTQALIQVLESKERRDDGKKSEIWLHVPLQRAYRPKYNHKDGPEYNNNDCIKNLSIDLESVYIRGPTKVPLRVREIPYGQAICRINPALADKRAPLEEHLHKAFKVHVISESCCVIYWEEAYSVDVKGARVGSGIVVHQKEKDGAERTFGYGFSSPPSRDALSYGSHMNGKTFLTQITMSDFADTSWRPGKLLVVSASSEQGGGFKKEEILLKPCLDSEMIHPNGAPLPLYPIRCVAQDEDRFIFSALHHMRGRMRLVWIRLSDTDPTFKPVPKYFTNLETETPFVDTFGNTLVDKSVKSASISDATVVLHYYPFLATEDKYGFGKLKMWPDEPTVVGTRLHKLGNDYYLVRSENEYESSMIYPQAAIHEKRLSNCMPYFITGAFIIDAIVCDKSRRLFLAAKINGDNYVVVLDLKRVDAWFSPSAANMKTDYNCFTLPEENEVLGTKYISMQAGRHRGGMHELYLDGEGLLYVRFGREFEIFSI